MAEVKMGIAGVGGRMGQALVRQIAQTQGAALSAATEMAGHPCVGDDAGSLAGLAPAGVRISDMPKEAFNGVDVIIDFTAPAATVTNTLFAADRGIAHIIGTTGLSDQDHAAIDRAAEKTVIVQAGNMSLGVNLLAQLTQRAAQILDADFDIEIVEMHHRHKVDAPSGTALMLGEAAAAGRGTELAKISERGRDGHTGARQRGAIGFASLRGGSVVGEHSVVFAADMERIELVHKAEDRAIFARGAVHAALWTHGQSPGRYTMADVLSL